ncbi:amino acid ABC transporter membrane protein 1, PAAT family (TC 3.A.1.3.-) [Pasteurella testudinis DSM 23072]|uniref:Amino acid ABC transporter membrane protein 1, PAAT family (TC 3.A.1.3.-) n=1 Tax=Pasteurella testudinis DSM 23072 TaxID=1122938 RepID=A0A1W1UZF6_9PAST|nr:arginine ABC transporter permease ArtQ [Pasteurella testudinis]SMB86390.1 amino acid ABC transporter membrane protein 1, PAAT family (TC 3.A.1.3.-) [Pasteurella testudinis DSM 23072]SUB51784.1 arginine ABC transporter permease protein ArtQ [Pasteurella testudinis]
MFSNFLSLMLSATLMTLGLAVCALILGLLLSMIFVVLETAKLKCIRNTTSVVLTLLRGLPEILVVLLIYFGSTQVLFMLTGDFIEFSPFWSGVVALAIIFSAYASQSLRGAIQAIPLGQWESASALGLNRAQAFIAIIMPQVWRHALPGLSNQWLILLKDTALVSLIGVNDLMRQAELSNANTHQPFTWYGIAALLYLAVTILSKIGIARLEQRFTRFEREAA